MRMGMVLKLRFFGGSVFITFGRTVMIFVLKYRNFNDYHKTYPT
jgi:hypothetical protein